MGQYKGGGIDILGRMYSVVSGVSSRFCVHLQKAGLADDRVGYNIESMMEIIHFHLDHLFAVKKGTWTILSSIVDEHEDFRNVQNKTLYSTMIIAAYMYSRSIVLYTTGAWDLCRGDYREKLRNVREGPCPTDPILRRVWHLSQPDINYNPLHLQEFCLAMRGLSGISRKSEKFHAATSNAQYSHPQAADEHIMMRAAFAKAMLKNALVHFCHCERPSK